MAGPVRIGVVGAGAVSVRGILPHLTQADVPSLPDDLDERIDAALAAR